LPAADTSLLQDNFGTQAEKWMAKQLHVKSDGMFIAITSKKAAGGTLK
jgi:hypothetical protein